MSKFLITGGAGYIGNVLIRQILDLGHKVRCIDNFHKGECDALLGVITNPNFEFMYGDVTQLEDCKKFLTEDIDYIIILSAIVGFPAAKRHPTLSYAVTVDGVKNILKVRSIVNHKIPLFFASTGSVYGKLEEICTEQSPTNPQSLYGIHKLEAEKIVRSESNTLSYRFSTCFGVSPNMRVNLLINDLVFKAVTEKCIVIFEPDVKRTFIEIKDFCSSILFGLDNIENFKYNLYNCGDESMNCTKREIAEIIRKKTGCVVSYAEFAKDMDLRDYAVNFTRIKNEGFKCKYTIEDGINDLIKTIPTLNTQSKYQ